MWPLLAGAPEPNPCLTEIMCVYMILKLELGPFIYSIIYIYSIHNSQVKLVLSMGQATSSIFVFAFILLRPATHILLS